MPEFISDEPSKDLNDGGDVSDLFVGIENYTPHEIVEPEYREPIGKFSASILEAFTNTGEKDGRKWGNVKIKAMIDDDTVRPQTVDIVLWLGDEPPQYGNTTQTNNEIFLDTMFTAGLDFDVKDFDGSLKRLSGKSCWIKSKTKMKKVDGKFMPDVSEGGYKRYKATLIAPETLAEEAPF